LAFRFVDHDADIAVELFADDREGLFRVALESLIRMLTGNDVTQNYQAEEDLANNIIIETFSVRILSLSAEMHPSIS